MTLCSPTTLPPRSARKADVAAAARTGDAVANPDRVLRQIDRRAPRRRPRPSISAVPDGASTLSPVVHFDDLDIEVLVQRLGDAAGDGDQQVDAEAHVAGLDDGSVAGRRGNLSLVGLRSIPWCR